MESQDKIPSCVGIILDGNRRWARANGMLAPEGHKAGYETLKEIARVARDRGIQHLVAYVFSVENWKREQTEVEALLTLLRHVLETETESLVRERVRIHFVGDRTRFREDVQNLMTAMEAATAGGEHTLHLALSYGGRAEIVVAARNAAAEGEITEASLAKHLWTANMPDPDLIIRTGGEKRLSGFLPWQSVYSELFFTKTLWPDFNKEEFESILEEYHRRKRNFGI